MKIAATTLGETAGGLLSMTLKVGYAVSSMILIGLFFAALVTQLRSKKYHPLLYWTVILSTSTAGTTMSDYMDRTLGLGYAKGSLILVAILLVIFLFWRLSGHSIFKYLGHRFGRFPGGHFRFWICRRLISNRRVVGADGLGRVLHPDF